MSSRIFCTCTLLEGRSARDINCRRPAIIETEETLMTKIGSIIGTSALMLFLGVAAPAYAAARPQDKPQDQPDKPADAKPPHDEPKPKTDPAKTPADKPRPDEKEAAPPKEEHPKGDQEHVAQQSSHGGAARIPDDKFKAHFGREHTFHVGHPQIVGGQPHFQYGGYSFIIAQPWPTGWGYNDNVYIIDIDGVYYLVDDVHPGVQLALTVVL
jgi:hypothetical protein